MKSQRHPSDLLNRELSWLEFNDRVLQQAANPNNPPLERAKFLAITASNLDEFVMIRIGGLHVVSREKTPYEQDATGRTPEQQLVETTERMRTFVASQDRVYFDTVLPSLSGIGIAIKRASEWSDVEAAYLASYFRSYLFDLFTAVDVSLRSAFLEDTPGGIICLAILAKAPLMRKAHLFVVRTVPSVPRLVKLPGHNQFALVEDVLQAQAEAFVPGHRIVGTSLFRVTRNADVELHEEESTDLVVGMQESLDRRKLSYAARLETTADSNEQPLALVATALNVRADCIFSPSAPLDLTFLFQVWKLEGFANERDDPWPPRACPQLTPRACLFDVLARQNVLIFHPYQSFAPVVRLVEQAAADPQVLAIKIVLYRTGSDSAILDALIQAARQKKAVTALVELKARFEEERNIKRAQELELAGAQVLYGVRWLKTHAKICMIIRRDSDGLRRYVHFGTGNYNEITAGLYTDISFLTADEDLCADGATFLNAVTGTSQPQPFTHLAASPKGIREKLLRLIDIERRHASEGRPARIRAKLNSLVDPNLIRALYEASTAGVDIDLNVRGTCCLRPGIAGLSERIRVVSIVDRFLEHARIVHFHNGGNDLVFISSADWMPRNLDRRIELLVPINDVESKARLIEALDISLADNVSAWEMDSDGKYNRRSPGAEPIRSQERLYEIACALAAQPTPSRAAFAHYRASS